MNATAAALPTHYWTFKRLGAVVLGLVAIVVTVVTLTLAVSGTSASGRPSPIGAAPSRVVDLPERSQLRW